MSLDALIIGGDSKVGIALRSAISATGREVISTTRRFLPLPDGWGRLAMLPFDLRYQTWLPTASVTYFCTGINGFKPCEEDPAEARRINVELLLRAAGQVAGAGCRKLVFLSSAAAETHPDTVYGRCKIDAEIGFMKFGAACYRFGPIAFQGRHVYPNPIYCPINLSTLTKILIGCFTTWEPGIHSVYNRDWVKEAEEQDAARSQA